MSEEEYQRSLSAVVQKIRTAMTIKQSLERHIQLARKTGRTDLEIGDDIRTKLRGELPDDTIRKYLPTSLKHQEKTNTRYAGLIPHTKQPNIPAPPQPIIDIEQSSNTEPLIVDRKVRLDTAKFRSDLRIALINGDKIWLTCNSANEVIKISE